MSHFTVMVIGNNPTIQLKPFDENIQVREYVREIVSDEEKQRFIDYYIKNNPADKELSFDNMYEKHGREWNNNDWRKDSEGVWKEYSTYNPKSKWDWYQLGGRWSGNYITHLKADAKGRRGEASLVAGNQSGIDSARKGDIDFAAIRKQAEDEAAKDYDDTRLLLASVFGNEEKMNNAIAEYKTWEYLRDEIFKDNIDKARDAYHGQEIVKAYNIACPDAYPFGAGVAPYTQDRDKIIKQAGERSFSTFAVLKDGKWYEKGQMGWWGAVSNEKNQDEWNKQVWELVNSLPDDTLISIYDCHI